MTDAIRETSVPMPNPLGLDGIEFIEYRTDRPHALSQLLEQLGFKPVARHRSREVLLMRQGGMNVVINAHDAANPSRASAAPEISAIAFRVQDAARAYQRLLDLGAWPVAQTIKVMELNIPGIHGVGAAKFFFVDRYQEFSIYDVDFVPIPGVDLQPNAVAGLDWFGVVHYVGLDRSQDWIAFYTELFGMVLQPEDTRYGILPKGRILTSPCGSFHFQLVEPLPDTWDRDHDERLHRVAFGAPDVGLAVQSLQARGLRFLQHHSALQPQPQGALTEAQLGGVMFELVHNGAGS